MSDRPLPPGPIEFDEQGDPVPVPPAGSDLAALIQLLEYGRRKGFLIGPAIRVGSIVLQVRDLRQPEAEGHAPADPEPSIWARHGADDE